MASTERVFVRIGYAPNLLHDIECSEQTCRALQENVNCAIIVQLVMEMLFGERSPSHRVKHELAVLVVREYDSRTQYKRVRGMSIREGTSFLTQTPFGNSDPDKLLLRAAKTDDESIARTFVLQNVMRKDETYLQLSNSGVMWCQTASAYDEDAGMVTFTRHTTRMKSIFQWFKPSVPLNENVLALAEQTDDSSDEDIDAGADAAHCEGEPSRKKVKLN